MRENRPSGSEGGVAFGPSLPLSILPSPGSEKIAEAHAGVGAQLQRSEKFSAGLHEWEVE